MSRILTIAFTMSLFCTSAVADTSDATSEPRLKTEPALACVVGLAPKGCEKIFGSGAVLPPWKVGIYLQAEGPVPYFRSAQYAGLDGTGRAVWDVHFKHTEFVYVISQPDQDGKIRRVEVLSGPLVCMNRTQAGGTCNPRRPPRGG